VNGIMPYIDDKFALHLRTSGLSHYIEKPIGDGSTEREKLVLVHNNPIRPSNKTILYYLEFNR